MFHPIAIGLSPNTSARDVVLAKLLFLQPWRWKKGGGVKKVEKWFKQHHGNKYNFAVDSGRSAIMLALEALEIGEGDEVIVQAFTCTAVPAALIWQGATPVWVDCDDTYNMDVGKIETAVTENTKAIIVQHTFGTPANMDAVMKLADKHHIAVIEDCAHALGAAYHDKQVGSFGDVAIFSFGRDKVVSSVSGGLVSTNQKVIKRKLKKRVEQLKTPSMGYIAKQLFHIIFFTFWVLPLYRIGVGKVLHGFARAVRLTSYAVTAGEKKLEKPEHMPARLPNALARIALSQLRRLDHFNTKRRTIAEQYEQTISRGTFQKQPEKAESMYLRVGLEVTDKKNFLKKAQHHGMYLGDWYNDPIYPLAVAYEKINYTTGSCPRAEQLAQSAINLPTYPRLTPKQIQKVIDFTNNHA